ncbi:MAG: dihydrolipoyllysine-residue acetyltransferase [Methylococcales bacterium]|nr:dihydrolipoyllysine-residue acetyltransferase [Methylococcales bacterium]
MSEIIEIKVPDLGGSSEVDVVEVTVKAGDSIELEQTLAILESDKATMDLPSTEAGIIKEVKIKPGDKVSQDDIIALVEVAEAAASPSPQPESVEKASEPSQPPATPEPEPELEAKPELETEQPAPQYIASAPEASAGSSVHATPAVRLFARELGVDLSRINQGSGRKGRILKDDVKQFVKQQLNASGGAIGGAIEPIPAVDFSQFGDTETLPLKKIKRLTGQNMTRVWLNLPMVTHHEQADITELEAFRKQLNAEGKHGKLTGLVFIIKALAATLAQFPNFNASLSPDGASLIVKKYFHIGIAVDTPNGLVVPVLRDVERKGLAEISAELTELSEKARAGKLKPIDMQGGSMTISSLGGIGGTAFTPIVNAPEVAILGLTRHQMQPVWDGETFIPRLMLPLDLTYDHRVIDGAEAARFMVALAERLADVRRLLL